MTSDSPLGIAVPDVLRASLLDDIYLRSANDARPVQRIGVLLDSEQPAALFAAVLDHISRSNHSRIEAVVVNGLPARPSPHRPGAGKLRKLITTLRDKKLRHGLAWTVYSRYDERLAPQAVDLLRPVDCSSLLTHAVRIVAAPDVKGFVHRFDTAVVQQLSDLDLDVILRFGFNIIRGGILKCARYGIWSFHHGDNEFYRGGPPHFWEIHEGNPCSGAILQVLNEELDNGLVLDRIVSSTQPGISVGQNRLAPYVTSAHMVIRALHALHEQGWEAIVGRAPEPVPYRGKRKLYRTPGNREMAAFVLGKLARSARLRAGNLVPKRTHWRIGFRPAHGQGEIPASVQGIRWLESPRGFFHADPFILRHGGRSWVFVEEFDYARQRGHIACAELNGAGLAAPFQPVIEEPWHLSYPFVFEHDTGIYMIPEAAESGKVTLYRAEDFPFRWVRERELFPHGLLDVTMHRRDGLCWFFGALVDPPAASDRLCLFSSDGLFEPWKWHPANPISADVRRARPAGRIFNLGGTWIRPAQDCAERYGHAIRFLRIDELSTASYRESEIAVLRPPEGVLGVHTFDSDGCFEVMDQVQAERCSRVG
ncbi:MAG: hypothetical protein IPM24_03185 [Bryobacterales bacterium]|nr:hypothetical protein [Bryobacterales bacterium]